MSQDNLLVIGCMLSAGFVLVVFGVLVRTGRIRYWWASPYYAAGQEPYVSLPGGLFFLVVAIAALFPAKMKPFFLVMAIACIFSALVFLIAKPCFLKPQWLQWLEDNHKQDIPLLRKNARAMGHFQWARRVETQAGLEKWVDDVLSGRA